MTDSDAQTSTAGDVPLTLPLIVFGDEDVLFFDSVDLARTYLEPPDVEQGIYTGFDAVGHSLRIDTPPSWLTEEPTGFRARLRWRFQSPDPVIVSAPSGERRASELARKLAVALGVRLGASELAAERSLPELVEAGKKRWLVSG